MLVVRTPVVSYLIAGGIVALAIALQPQPRAHARLAPIAPIGRCHDDAPARVAVPPPACTLDGRVAELYRAKRFLQAANTVPAGCRDEAELLGHLSIAWDRGMDRGAEPSARFPMLQRARELDLVLGGAHGDAIDDAMRTIVGRAALWFAAENQRDSAEQAVAVGGLLGVHGPAMHTAERWLAEHPR